MPDIMSKEQRSRNMKRMKSSGTAIEVRLQKTLWGKGFRYTKNDAKLPGKPDVVLKRYKIAIFCDGEFFHGKDWEKLREKLKNSNNGDFWINKIGKNIERDNEVNQILSEMGYIVLRFWGEDIKKNLDECIRTIESYVALRRR